MGYAGYGRHRGAAWPGRVSALLALVLSLSLQGRAQASAASVSAARQSGSVATSPSISQVLREVESNYNRMKTMKAQFRQIVREGRRTVRQEEGTLYLSKPGKMRWEYTSPENKLFLTESNRMILYLPAENRLMQTSVKETDDMRAPLRFLLGRLDFEQEFNRFETSATLQPLEQGNIIFKTYPKRLAGQVDWMIFEIASGRTIRRVIVSEPTGTETEFRFSGEQVNLPVPAAMFRFAPPAGTEIVYQ